jgi:hypothetical protein
MAEARFQIEGPTGDGTARGLEVQPKRAVKSVRACFVKR